MATWKFDFSGVDDSKGSIAPGKYIAKVDKITQQKKEGGEYPYLKWELTILTGSAKGLHINHITTLNPAGLFNLRDTLQAIGLKVPKSAVNVDPAKLIGKQLGIETFMKAQDGNEYANVKKVFPVSEVTKPETVTPTAVSYEEEEDVMVLTDEDL
jgi:hypothetical protein